MGEHDTTEDIIHRLRMMATDKTWSTAGGTRPPAVEIVHAAANEIERLRELIRQNCNADVVRAACK